MSRLTNVTVCCNTCSSTGSSSLYKVSSDQNRDGPLVSPFSQPKYNMSVTDALKQKVTSVTETAKIADLQRDLIDQSKGGLTTDHGVKVSDHDNW